MGGKKWSKNEEKLLINTISSHPENLTSCFLAVANETGRSPKAVMLKYYQSIKPKKDIFTLQSTTKQKNCKVVKQQPQQPLISDKWMEKLVKIFKILAE